MSVAESLARGTGEPEKLGIGLHVFPLGCNFAENSRNKFHDENDWLLDRSNDAISSRPYRNILEQEVSRQR